MIRVPVAATPIQTFAVVLNNQACEIQLRQNGENIFFDLSVNDTPIVLSRIVRNKQRLLLDVIYKGFQGDFLFNDTQGDTQPYYTGLNTRYLLYYLAPGDLPV